MWFVFVRRFSRARLFHNVLQRASGVSDVLSMYLYLAQMEQREDFLGKKGARQGRWEAQGWQWDLLASGRHR